MCDIFLGNLVLVLANGGEQQVIFFTITNCSSVRIQRYYLLKIALPLVESFFLFEQTAQHSANFC